MDFSIVHCIQNFKLFISRFVLIHIVFGQLKFSGVNPLILRVEGDVLLYFEMGQLAEIMKFTSASTMRLWMNYGCRARLVG